MGKLDAGGDAHPQAGLVATIVRQFARPRGFVGRIVGIILANRSSNVLRSQWTVERLGISTGDRVLEIGCGPGVALKACLERLRDGTALGVDHSEVMIAQARRRNAKAIRKKRLKLIAGTIDDLPADEPPFDRIFSINVIQFVADKNAFVKICADRLAPNGLLATTFQPRGTKPTREAALAMAHLLTELMARAGLTDVRTETLELKPIPAICALGRKTASCWTPSAKAPRADLVQLLVGHRSARVNEA
jgi:SAM-dependent methyltransferase